MPILLRFLPLLPVLACAPSFAPAQTGAVLEPEVTIIQTETETIHEYRVKGQIYMVRVDPVAGPPYYLLDTDGDGVLDVQQARVPDLAVPQWLLFRW